MSSKLFIIFSGIISLFFHQTASITPVQTPLPNHYLILEQKITTANNSKLQVELKIFNQKHQPFSNCYITVYRNQDNDHQSEYPFSILKTDDSGLTTFTLQSGKFFLVISSNESKYPGISLDDYPFFIINHQLEINGPSPLKTSIIELTENHIGFKNIGKIPLFKLEANVHIGDSLVAANQTSIASNNSPDHSNITFYTNPGVYNFNLDQTHFSPQENITYALSKYDFHTPQDNQIIFDFSQLKTSTVSLKGISYSWFKFIANGIGDFQSMYFGQPVTIKTNTDNLFLEMVYITNQKCLRTKIDNGNDPQTAMNICTTSDIRYDYVQDPAEAVYLKPNQHLDIFPPENLEVKYQPGNISFFLNNHLHQKISAIFIHQLWDQNIVPHYYFINSKKQIALQFYPFSDQTWDSYKQPVCLPPDKYQINASIPSLLWGESKLLTNNTQKFEILPGSSNCPTPTIVQPITPNNNFSSWEDLYQNKGQLFLESTGYLKTFPQFGSHPEHLDISQTNYVSQCSDLQRINSQLPIFIDLNQNNTLEPKTSSQFKDCLQQFVAKNYQLTFILHNSFADDVFSNRKSYVFYYYYLLLHQNKANQVGIIADTFQDIFYGFPEFYFISSDLQNKFLHKDILESVISDYQLIVDPKNIFYQQP